MRTVAILIDGGHLRTYARKARQFSDTYWLSVIRDSLGESSELARIKNPAARLGNAKREIVTVRFFEIQAEVVMADGWCES